MITGTLKFSKNPTPTGASAPVWSGPQGLDGTFLTGDGVRLPAVKCGQKRLVSYNVK